jgi:hypothetical protein
MPILLLLGHRILKVCTYRIIIINKTETKIKFLATAYWHKYKWLAGWEREEAFLL